MDPLVEEWNTFVDRCLERRIQPDLFSGAAEQLYAKSPLPGVLIATILLRPRSAGAIALDPRLVIYLERLLALKKVDASDVLYAVFQFSKDKLPKAEDASLPKKSRWFNPFELEEIVFHRLHKTFAAEERPYSSTEGFRTLLILTRWVQVMVAAHTSDTMIQAMVGIQQQPQQQAINVREALGVLMVAIVENSRMIHILNHDKSKGLRKAFSQALSSFITLLSHNPLGSQSFLQIASRLEISQNRHDFHDRPAAINGEAIGNASLEVAALQLDTVMDLPQINTRPGLYIFLNSLLVARPLTDDFTIINYLHSRYKVDAQNMATDLITASFDNLANAMYRNESTQYMFCLKSFLVNRIPSLLLQTSASIFPMTPELCITQALSHVDSNAFPAFSQGFDDIMANNNSLSDVRQDFLNACALYGLISTHAVERLLGETPMQGPPETKYEKKALLDQCKNNFDKISIYIDELENLDGNAGAIVGAVVEFVSYLCETQMTMYLKQLSTILFKKPQTLDVIFQFTSPASILRPLCQFLEDWHYDNDQGEYQPMYDEFGAVLVLAMTIIRRYEIKYSEIGIGRETFISRFIDHSYKSLLPDDMTEDQSKHLGNWLKGLFDSDKEGLSNDLFASCRPQDFYLIVPTLFHQTVMACSSKVLTFETVKGGLEYLGETFLLPSLIGGLSFLASYALLQTHNDLDAILRIFHEVVFSAPSSGDAQAMHSAILAMSSSQLEKSLRTLKRYEPGRTNIDPLLLAIRGNAHFERSVYASMKELEMWNAPPNSSLQSALQHSVQQLSRWATTSAIQLNPPTYTHRLVCCSLKLIGTHKTLRAIIEELKAQSEAGNGAAALDIGVSMICAPTVDDSPIPVDWVGSLVPATPPPRTRMNLREMLKHEYDNAASLVATDPLAAETIVRLHRRVEAQITSMGNTSLQAPAIDMVGNPMAGLAEPTISDDLSKAMGQATAVNITEDITTMDSKALQRSMEELGADGLDLSSMGMGIGGDASGATDLSSTTLGNLPDIDLTDMSGIGMDIDMSMDMGGGGDDDWGLDFDNM